MKKMLIYAGLACIVFFFLAGCSQSVTELKRFSGNWQGDLYVVENEVESLRQMYRDLGRKVFSWSEYTPKEIIEHQKTCLDEHGPGSFFVGDVKRANKSVDTYCAGAITFPPMMAVQICFAMNLEIAWMKPEEKKFACRVPGPPKVRT